MSDESDYDGSDMQCSYCGKWIYADAPRCAKCGNYTDGLGPYARAEKDGRQIPRMYLIAGWLVVIAIVAPLLIALIQWAQK
jgi:hypothetical protein